MRVLPIPLVALLVAGVCAAQTPPATVEAWRQAYQAAAAKATEETRSGLEAADHLCLAAMAKLRQTFGENGDLEKNLVVGEERASFELSRVPPQGKALVLIPELVPLLAELEKNRAAARRNGYASHLKAAVPYARKLAEFETAAARKGDVALAADLRAERTRIEEQIKTEQAFVSANPEPTAPPNPSKTPVRVVLPSFARMLTAVENKIILYLSFDADWGAGAVPDTSGSGIACPQTRAVFNTRGKRGGAADLGAKSELILPSHPALQGHDNLSVSLWFRTRESYGNLLVAEHDAQAEEAPLFAIVLRGDGRVHVSSDEFRVATNRDKLDNNQWHHLVVVKSPDDFTLYLDGEFAGKAPAKVSLKRLPRLIAGFETLRYDSYSGEYVPHRFTGTLDELVILNTALSAQEVKTIYQSQK